MIWRNPWAWTGLLLLALPVLIHLLSRAPADVRPFPSLRFINPSRLSPRRRTRPRDVLLLCIRLGIITAAVAALAGPVLLTARRAESPRTVRAIVLDTSASMARAVAGAPSRQVLDSATALAAAASDGAAVHTLVRSSDVQAGIGGALAWLSAHPGIRELVVISDFQRGSVDPSTLRDVPAGYGVRLVRVAGLALPDTFTSRSTAARTRVRALDDRTVMTWLRGDAANAAPAPAATLSDATAPAAAAASGAPRFQLRASPAHRSRALAAYAAALQTSGAAGASGAGDASGGDAAALERVAPPTATLAPSDARVQIVYVEGQAEGAGDRAIDLAGDPLSAAWMASLVVQIAADPLLRDVARDARAAGIADTTRHVVAATGTGVPLVQAAQDTSAGAPRLLLFCLADAGSAVSAALIAATSKALDAGARDSSGVVVPATANVPVHEREPLLVPDAELQQWNRAAGDSVASVAAVLSSADVEQGGASDARWFWALALLLLALEALVRRTGSVSAAETSSPTTSSPTTPSPTTPSLADAGRGA